MQKQRKLNKHTDIQCGTELTDIFQNALLLLEGGQRAQSAHPRKRRCTNSKPVQEMDWCSM